MSLLSISVTALAVTALLLGGCVSTGKVDTGAGEYSSTVTNRYARALGYMDAGNDSRAQSELEAFGESYPGFAGAQVNLGIIYGRSGRPDAAEAAFRRAVTVCSECASAYNHLGITQRQKGSFDDAEKSYLLAIKSDPQYGLAYYNLGVLYDLYRGRPDLALQYYEAYVEREADAAEAEIVRKWIIDLRRRVGEPRRAANSGGVR